MPWTIQEFLGKNRKKETLTNSCVVMHNRLMKIGKTFENGKGI